MSPRLLLPGLFLLAACSSTADVSSMLSPYRIDVRQGNFVTQEMVSRLRPGMSREQVRFALGSPLIADIFHADRWDYVYRFQPGHGEVQTRRLTVFFENDRLVRVGGDVIAATDEAPATASPQTARVIEVPGAPHKD
ncbi:MAG: outer membrane protein assembly factor BamE [Rhodocyclaceae bacterium]|nr:outer membrane protein assembly factor BamE [Rhodocyclaceae bacterium]